MASDLTALAAKFAELGTACAQVSTPGGWKILYESAETQRLNFAEADKAEGSGQVAVMSVPEGCRNAITGIVDSITEVEAAINTYADTLPGTTGTDIKNQITGWKNMVIYQRDAKAVAIVAQAAETNAAFTTVDAVIGVCLYQPAVSDTAACWGYQNRTSPGFDGYALTPAVWNALSGANQKLDPTILAAQKLSEVSADAYKVFRCIGLDSTSSVVDAGYKGALCVKAFAPESQKSATDPAFQLGSTTVLIYNSTRTTAQAANRNLWQTAGFQGNAFYSYDVNIGALSGISLSAAAISALALSYF